MSATPLARPAKLTNLSAAMLLPALDTTDVQVDMSLGVAVGSQGGKEPASYWTGAPRLLAFSGGLADWRKFWHRFLDC